MDLALLLVSDPARFRAAFSLSALQKQELKLNLRGRTIKENRKRARVQARAVQEYRFE